MGSWSCRAHRASALTTLGRIGGHARLATREQPGARITAERPGQLLDRLLLLLAELLWDVDHEAVVDVAAPGLAGAEPRRSLAAQTLDGAVGRAGSHAQRLGAIQRGHLHLRSAQRLGDAQWHLDLEIVALAGEQRGRGDVGDQIQVAGMSTLASGLALAGQADATAVAYARGNVHAQALDGAHRTAALTRRAGILDHGARSTAARARLG